MTQSNIGVTLDGVCTWQLLEGEEVVRGGVQHNLLLDSGLDNIGTYGLVNPYKYACVGTGTSEPAVTQTALDAEVARSLVRPSGYSDSPIYQSPGVYTLEIVREFSEASIANKNLTEWGFSPVFSGGVGVRERFRDDDGNPVTLTPDGSQKLRLTYEVSITLSPVTPQAFSVTVEGAGAASPGGTDTLSGRYLLHDFRRGNNDFNLVNVSLQSQGAYLFVADSTRSVLGYDDDFRADYTPAARASVAPYVVGSFERNLGSATIGAAEYTGEIRQLGLSASPFTPSSSYAVELDSQHIITKDDLHTLTIEGPIISWSRA